MHHDPKQEVPISKQSPLKVFRKLGGNSNPPKPQKTEYQNSYSPDEEPSHDPFTSQRRANQAPNYPPPPPWQKPETEQTFPPASQSWQEPTQQQTMWREAPPSQHVHHYYQASPSNGPSPDTAYILNLLLGLFGFFGIGHMYAGRTGEGAVMLIVGILANILFGFLAAITAGFFACIAIPFYILFAILSANSIKKYLLDKYQQNP